MGHAILRLSSNDENPERKEKNHCLVLSCVDNLSGERAVRIQSDNKLLKQHCNKTVAFLLQVVGSYVSTCPTWSCIPPLFIASSILKVILRAFLPLSVSGHEE